MKCEHDPQWLAYTNPVDVNSDQFCVFCELERLRFEAQKHQLQSHILKEAFERMKKELAVELRDYFAAAATDDDIAEWIPATQGAAMQLAASEGFDPKDWPDVCRRLRCWARYKHADAMIAERERKQTPDAWEDLK